MLLSDRIATLECLKTAVFSDFTGWDAQCTRCVGSSYISSFAWAMMKAMQMVPSPLENPELCPDCLRATGKDVEIAIGPDGRCVPWAPRKPKRKRETTVFRFSEKHTLEELHNKGIPTAVHYFRV